MPLYEYTCLECRERFEILVRPGEEAACPDCGSTQLEKQLSVPAAHTAKATQNSGGCGAPWCGTGECGM